MTYDELLAAMRPIETEIHDVNIRIIVLKERRTMLNRQARKLLTLYRKERGEST